MRFALSLLLAILTMAAAGCMGPERKLGRGIANFTEIARMGELRRSMEQSALWYGPDVAYSYGFVHGITRTAARTGLGVVEIVTFPFPPYDPMFASTNAIYPDYSVRNTTDWGGMTIPANPVYPENNKPGLM